MKPSESPRPREGLKDTIDSVVVAFILAFVFRAFIVEAFVIPTGSMAATLYGRHGTITCEECGWEYAYGLADQTGQSGNPVHRAVGADSVSLCQNCGHPNTNLEVNDRVGPRGNAEAGDRILVLKWLLDLGGERFGPRRWDVTVFKDPGEGGQNFIKRLVGLPDEVLEIIDGDVYVVPTEELPEQTMTTLTHLRHLKFLNRADVPDAPTDQELREAQLGWQAARKELDAKLRILRKTPAAQEALWTMVHDLDYPVRRLNPGQPFWAPGDGAGSAWETSERVIRCHSLGTEAGMLRFAGKPINDMCAYNIVHPDKERWNPVADLCLDFVLVPRGGNGALSVALSKDDASFWGEIRADGLVTLYRTKGKLPDETCEPLCQNRLNPLPLDQPVKVSFRNVDYRVSLQVNGTEVLTTMPEQYAPNPATLRGARSPSRQPPRMWATDLDFELWHVVLRRDVYYTSLGNEGNGIPPGHTGWGTENNPIWLGPGEYFMLGDNSAASKDSRLWSEPGEHLRAWGEAYQVGTVPADLLIGRAFFVYWPSGLRSNLIPGLKDTGIIPNFGRMRWIR